MKPMVFMTSFNTESLLFLGLIYKLSDNVSEVHDWVVKTD